MLSRVSILVVAMSALVLTTPASAFTIFAPKSSLALPEAGKMVLGGQAAEPFGHFLLCRKNPGACRKVGGSKAQDGRVVLNAAMFAKISSVNASVNGSMKAAKEKTGDKWLIGGRSGDCEDFALTKRARLMRMGLPSSALTMATGTTFGGVRHAVLVVRTTRGDFVLDNLNNAVRPWNQSSLRIEAVQSPSNPREWRRV